MECLKSFSRRFFQSGGRGGGGVGGVKSILSSFNKQLVTLKFDTSAICFLLSGETIFPEIYGCQQFPILFVDFLWIPGRAMNNKRGTSLVTDWSLKQN